MSTLNNLVIFRAERELGEWKKQNTKKDMYSRWLASLRWFLPSDICDSIQ